MRKEINQLVLNYLTDTEVEKRCFAYYMLNPTINGGIDLTKEFTLPEVDEEGNVETVEVELLPDIVLTEENGRAVIKLMYISEDFEVVYECSHPVEVLSDEFEDAELADE